MVSEVNFWAYFSDYNYIYFRIMYYNFEGCIYFTSSHSVSKIHPWSLAAPLTDVLRSLNLTGFLQVCYPKRSISITVWQFRSTLISPRPSGVTLISWCTDCWRLVWDRTRRTLNFSTETWLVENRNVSLQSSDGGPFRRTVIIFDFSEPKMV